jgi:general secretion pathway protein I
MRATDKTAERGFTLIEVLAALVIVSLGMLAAIEAVSQTASNTTRMRDRTLAHWIALNRLTEVRLAPRAPSIGKSSDEIEMAERRWRWTMEVSETPVESIRRIDISVSEADDDRPLASVSGFYGTAIATTRTLSPWSAARRLAPGEEAPGSRAGDEDITPGDSEGDRRELVDPPLPSTEENEP